MSMSARKAAIVAAFIYCFGLSAILLWEGVLANKIAHDFSVYYRVATGPVSQAYVPAAQPFPYAPTMLFWVKPLGLLPKWPAYFLLAGSSIAALIWACRTYLSKAALALVLISPPFVRCIRNGQVSALMAALLIWACGTPKRYAAGFVIGVILSIKPQLVLMAPLMLAFNKDRDAFWMALFTFGAFVQMSEIFYGFDRWREWVAAMPHFQSLVTDTNVIRIAITPAAIAVKYGLPGIPFMLLGALAGAGVVYLCRNSEPIEKAAAITIGSLMAAPYALAYDLVGVVPFLAVAVLRGRLSAVFGLAAVLNPLPLAVTVFELLGRYRPAKKNELARCDVAA